MFDHILINGRVCQKRGRSKAVSCACLNFFITFDFSFFEILRNKKTFNIGFLKIWEPNNLTRINFANVKAPCEINDLLTKKLTNVCNDFLVKKTSPCHIFVTFINWHFELGKDIFHV